MNLYSIPPLLTLLCFIGLALLTVLRGQRTKTNLLFLVICILGSFLYIDILFVFNATSARTALTFSRIDHFFVIYLFPVYIHFFHTYLNIKGRKWLVGGAYAYAFLLMCLTPTPVYIESMQRHFFGFFARGGQFYLFAGLGGFLATIYILLLLYKSIQAEKNSIQKNKLKYVFSGFGIMGLMNSLNIFPIMGYSVYPPGNLSFIPLFIFAVGLFKHDLLDMGFLIKKSLIYSILSVLLTCLYALIIIAVNFTFKGFNFSNSIYFHILFLLLVAFILGPLKTGIQTYIDRIFYKGKYDYQKTIKDICQLIVSIMDMSEIGKRLTETIAVTLVVDNCALFLKSPDGSHFLNFSAQGKFNEIMKSHSPPADSPLVKSLLKDQQPIIRKRLIERAKDPGVRKILGEMDALHAVIILPMIFKNSVNGFIIIGEKLSGDLFTKEDIDLLETLSSQGALAFENARAYEKIDDLNKNLEKKVAERTRSLEEALIEKEKAQELLIRSESLAAIGQLVAGVAHELNNPLTSVKSLVQATIEDLEEWNKEAPPGTELIEDLRFADKEIERTRTIVTSLLGLSRQSQTYSEAVNMNAFIKDALRVLYNQYKHLSLDIVEEYDPNLPDIQGNFANLGQVALNIIQNAIQAMIESPGSIYIKTYFDNHTDEVVFECKDTGPGIPDAIRNDIFKPFFTTKDTGKGTGLGLYLCHNIIQKHGGTLTLADSHASGSCFVVRLPVTG